VRGELDLLTRGIVDQAFVEAEAAGAPVRIVDLGELELMDCGGLAGLLAPAWRARADGRRRLVVLIGAGHGRRLLELLDMTADLDVVDHGSGSGAT
jgi:anti-anti-sigma regulatory factor